MGAVLAGLHAAGIDHRFFDLIVGTSIGATSAAYFITGQIRQGLRFFTQHMPREYIRMRLLGLVPTFDMRALEDAYRYSDDALNLELLRGSHAQLYMSLSDPTHDKVQFVCLNKAYDPIQVMLKGTSVPILSRNVACLGEGDKLWDGGFMCQPPSPSQFSLLDEKEEDTEFWYLSPFNKEYRSHPLKSWIFSLFLGAGNPEIRRMVAGMATRENAARDEIEQMPGLHIIRPDKPLGISWVETDVRKIKRVMGLGDTAVKKFLDNYNFKKGGL